MRVGASRSLGNQRDFVNNFETKREWDTFLGDRDVRVQIFGDSDETTPRHQTPPEDSGDRCFGGYFGYPESRQGCARKNKGGQGETLTALCERSCQNESMSSECGYSTQRDTRLLTKLCASSLCYGTLRDRVADAVVLPLVAVTST